MLNTKISKDNMRRLEGLKSDPNESIDDVIDRLIDLYVTLMELKDTSIKNEVPDQRIIDNLQDIFKHL